MLVAKQLRGLLTVFEGKLQDAGLSATEKLWMQFSLHGPAHRPTCSWGSAMMVLEIARRPSRSRYCICMLFLGPNLLHSQFAQALQHIFLCHSEQHGGTC